jgi:hypothetical protein
MGRMFGSYYLQLVCRRTLPLLAGTAHNNDENITRLSAVTGWESAATEELEGTLGLVALDVLRIASRSRHNRALLLQLGVLPGLTRLMKVGFAPFSECTTQTAWLVNRAAQCGALILRHPLGIL